MKLALRSALVLIYSLGSWVLIGQISTEFLLKGGLFLIFVTVSTLVCIFGRRAVSKPINVDVGLNIQPDVDESSKGVQKQKVTYDTPGLRLVNSKIEYPYRRCLPGDEQAKVTTVQHLESSFPACAPFPTLVKQSDTDAKKTLEFAEAAALRNVVSPKKISRRVKVFDPTHYSRHTGVPGFLYIARNNFHQLGLHKLGYTTLAPSQRIKTLNQQHARASDVGAFTLVHAVEVSGSYDAEQALFDAIADTRVAEKREFFFERSDFFIHAAQAASCFNSGNPNALDDFLDWSLSLDSWEKYRPASVHSVSVPPKVKITDGWIYVARNQWHRESILRIGQSKNDPQIKVDELNRMQRQLTCQIGFYKLVECVVVDDLQYAFSELKKLIQQYKIPGERVFFDIPLSHLRGLILDVTREGARCSMNTTPLEITDQISVDVVSMKPHPSWKAWTMCCPSCQQLLRFRGTVAAVGIVACPTCVEHIHCRIGASKVEFPSRL